MCLVVLYKETIVYLRFLDAVWNHIVLNEILEFYSISIFNTTVASSRYEIVPFLWVYFHLSD